MKEKIEIAIDATNSLSSQNKQFMAVALYRLRLIRLHANTATNKTSDAMNA